MQDRIYEEVPVSRELHSRFLLYDTENHFVPPHWHKDLEIIYMQKGRLEAVLFNRTISVREEEFLIIPSCALHSTYNFAGSTVQLLQIPESFLVEAVPDYSGAAFENRPDSHDGRTAGLLKEMGRLWREKENGYTLKYHALLYELLYLLFCRYRTPLSPAVRIKSEKNRERLDRIMAFVREHCREPLTLRDAAAFAGLEPAYFCRFFKRQTGLTFSEYVNSVRLLRIYQDLLETDLSITDILADHGFTNYKLFLRMFKKVYGCTPSQARKNSRTP